MSKALGKKVGQPRCKGGKTVSNSPASLPPQVPDVDAGAADSTAMAVPEVPSKPAKPFWQVPKGSSQYELAQKVLALKTVGMDTAAICEALGIAKQTVHNLTYIAGKNGWLTEFQNAREQIEYRIMPKVLRELEDGLDDQTRHVTSGMPVAKQIALEVAGGTVFKSFESAGGGGQSPTNVIGIKIEMVNGATTEMREGSGGGIPAYSEGVVDVDGDE